MTTADPTTAIPKTPGSNDQRPGRDSLDANRRRVARNAYLLILPTIVAMAVVVGYPILVSVINSFQADPHLDVATGFNVQGGFVGFQNYTHWLLQQCTSLTGKSVACAPGQLANSFWSSVFVTFFFAVTTVVLETIFGLWMAIIMNRNFRGRGILRAAVLVPWAIPTAVTAKLWFFIFATDGILNTVLRTQIIWGSDLWASRVAIIVADVWKTTPFMALLILAGMQLIPEDTYEAARMDGASTIQTFRRITLPLLKPALVVAILFRTLDALRMYDLPAILTGGGGGRGDATTTLSILVVKQIQQGLNAASALSTITFIIIFAVAFIFIRLFGANVSANEEKARKAAKEA
jgi:ABC-type sugar transport system permease subunit